MSSSEEESVEDTEEMEVDDNEEDSSSEEEPEEVIRSRVESLVAGRSRRANAGAKMATLIDNLAALTQSTEDDVYQTAYGGFNEENDDKDFASNDEEADDELDSDFDVDETVEATEEAVDEEDEGRKRRPKKTTKMAYEVAAARRAQKDKKTVEKPKASKRPARSPAKPTVKSEASIIVEDYMHKRSLRVRKAPASVDEDAEPRHKRKRSSTRGQTKGKEAVDKVWTQEELLKEAKETERENLASLQKYQLLELERIESKKKAKRHTREMPASFIRITSFTMPDVEAETEDKDAEDNILVGTKKRERTLVSFSDDAAFASAFPHLSQNKTVKKRAMDIKRGSAICPISNLRARYFDPVTQLPFASSMTFRALREAYCNQLIKMYGNKKQQGDSSTGEDPQPMTQHDIELQAWIEWKKKDYHQTI